MATSTYLGDDVPEQDYKVIQGADTLIELEYCIAGPDGTEVPEDLTLPGRAVRMDLVAPDGTVAYTFNTDDEDPETVDEIEPLGAQGEIRILLSRSLTLPGGALYEFISREKPVLTFHFDVFLRRPLQEPILKGKIRVERSYTLWA